MKGAAMLQVAVLNSQHPEGQKLAVNLIAQVAGGISGIGRLKRNSDEIIAKKS